MTLQPRCEDVETAEGVAITVTGVAQVRPRPLLKYLFIHLNDLFLMYQKRLHKCSTISSVGVALSSCLLQVKVMTEQDLLAVACEQFLGKSVMEIKAVLLQTLEGHLRSILGLDQ